MGPPGGPASRAPPRRRLPAESAALAAAQRGPCRLRYTRGPGDPQRGPDEEGFTGLCGRVHGLGGEAAPAGAQRGDTSVAETRLQAREPPGGEAGLQPGAPALGLALREPQALQPHSLQRPFSWKCHPACTAPRGHEKPEWAEGGRLVNSRTLPCRGIYRVAVLPHQTLVWHNLEHVHSERKSCTLCCCSVVTCSLNEALP